MPKLAAIKTLIEQGKHKEALRALHDIESECIGSEREGLYYLLKSEASLFVGEYDQEYADLAVNFFRMTAKHGEYALAKYLKAWHLQAVNRKEEAQEPLIESYATFLRVEDFRHAARSLNRLSYLKFECGNVAGSLESLSKSMEYYEKGGDALKAQQLRVNRAAIHFVTGSIKEAASELDDTEEMIERFPDRTAGVFHMYRGIVYALKGEFPMGVRSFKRASTTVAGYKRDEANLLEYQGWLLYLKGDYQEARSVLLEGLLKANAIAPQSALISQTKRLLADANLELKDYQRAKTYATEALEVAEKINERAEIAACQRVFARLAAHDRKNNEARDWFTKAINLYSVISSRYELAVTRYHAARSGAFPPAEATAMLSMAYEYFVSEEVEPWIDRTGKALAEMKKSSPVTIKRPPESALPTIITQNVGMRKLLNLAENIAPSEMTVLLTGETGTGKDLLARYIHAFSGRTGEFVPVNAAAIPRDMAESELFGHSKGAFTGAATARKGLFEQAEGGTFYLNEIGDTDSAFQAKLLEVLETKTIRMLGENTGRTVGFRLIAATNHNLQKRVQEGSFRLDLYHRLNQIPIQLPSLGDRLGDIPLLLVHFLGKSGGGKAAMRQKRLIDKMAKRLQEIIWPGNIRQLESDIKRWWHDSDNNLSRMLDLLPEPADLSRDRLINLLQETDWNRRETARLLNVSEGTVRYRMKKLGLDSPAVSH